MAKKTLFQGLITPDNSGNLPRAEGAFLFEQSYNNQTGVAKTFVMPPLLAAEDYFIVLISASFITTGGNNPQIRAYPPGTTFKSFDGADQAGVDLRTMTYPARLPIPAHWQLISTWLNAPNLSFGTVSYYGVQLLDCFENCASLLRASIL